MQAISVRRLTADEYTDMMDKLDGVRQVMIDRELCVSQVFDTRVIWPFWVLLESKINYKSMSRKR